MASQSLDKNKRAIAQNLIDTCGLQRAYHAAKQYGWTDIAEEIAVAPTPPYNTRAPHASFLS